MQGSNWLDRLQWVREHSPLTKNALSKLQQRASGRLAVRFHIDLKMVPVIEGLAETFQLLVFPCHIDTTDPQGWNYLKQHTQAHLEESWNPDICGRFVKGEGPSYLCDLGGEMIAKALELDWPVTAASEGTTSGLHRLLDELQRYEARFPILDWNNARLKRKIHNEKMVGFSLWQTFTEVTRLSLHGRTVGVLGFGPVGQGIARVARSLGGIVLVHDPNPESSILAAYEGFAPVLKAELLRCSNILVTATGARKVLNLSDLDLVASGTFLVNAGHSEEEISSEIRELPRREQVLNKVERLHLAQERFVYLLAGGRLLNLAAGFGDTINAFDITSAQLVATIHAMTQCRLEGARGLQVMGKDFLAKDTQLTSPGGSESTPEVSGSKSEG